MSIRAWLAVMLVGTVCAMALMEIEITGFFGAIVGSAIGCYFGQKEKPGVVSARPKTAPE